MFKKAVFAMLLALPGISSAGVYFTVGGAAGSTDLGDIEDTYGARFDSDDDVQRAVIGLGASVSEYLAFEGVYMTEVDNEVADRFNKDELSHSGIQLAVIGSAPVTPQFSLLGKLTANMIATEYAYTGPVVAYREDSSGTYLGFGVGAGVQINDRVGLRLMAERIQIKDVTILNANLKPVEADFDVDQFSLAVNFNF